LIIQFDYSEEEREKRGENHTRQWRANDNLTQAMKMKKRGQLVTFERVEMLHLHRAVTGV